MILCTRLFEWARRLVLRFDDLGRFGDATERFVETGGSEAEQARERSEGGGDSGRDVVGDAVCARIVEDC